MSTTKMGERLCDTMRGKPNRLVEEATKGHDKCIEILMKRRKHDKKYLSKALMAAVRRREIKSVETLARLGADVNAPHDGATPMEEAVNEGYYNVCKELVKAGASVNQTFNSGETPLKRAVGKGYHRTVKVLLESGADVSQTFTNGTTLLRLAVDKGYRETLKVLLESRIDLKRENGWYLLSSTRRRLGVLNVLLDGGLDVNTRSHLGSTLLMVVVEETNTPCIRFLLKRNCEINRMDPDGFNALMNHIGCATKVRRRIVMLLFAAGEQIVPGAWKMSSKRDIKIPRCVEKCNLDNDLKAACRETIRKHLMNINPHGNLFDRTARLGLPSLLRDFLLYHVSLENREHSGIVMAINKTRTTKPVRKKTQKTTKPVEILDMPIW